MPVFRLLILGVVINAQFWKRDSIGQNRLGNNIFIKNRAHGEEKYY